jgi:hypothetical protein
MPGYTVRFDMIKTDGLSHREGQKIDFPAIDLWGILLHRVILDNFL